MKELSIKIMKKLLFRMRKAKSFVKIARLGLITVCKGDIWHHQEQDLEILIGM